MATAAEVQTAYRAIVRTDLNATTAQAMADAINNGTATMAGYEASLIQQTIPTTSAAVAIASFVTGVAPTSDKLDALKVMADAQVASYTKMGVANPALGAYEAFGKDFSSTTEFATKYGALQGADFINTVYVEVFGALPSAAAAASLAGQLTYFTNLYTNAKLANAAELAKGAVLGQVVGYAFVDPNASKNAQIDNQVFKFLTDAANGSTTGYGAPLPAAPSDVAATFVLTTALDNIVGTAGNDIIIGDGATLTADSINGGLGIDTLRLTSAGLGLNGAPTMTSVENVEVSAFSAGVLNLTNSTGVQKLTSVGSSASFAFNGVQAIADLAISKTTAGNVSVNYTAAAVAGTSDVQKLALDSAIAGAVIVNGVETVAITSTGTNTLNALTGGGSSVMSKVTIEGAGTTAIASALDASVKVVDGSAATGAITVTLGNADTTVTGGSGDDTFNFGATFNSKDVVNGGSGTDTVSLDGGVYTAATNDVLKGLNALTSIETLKFGGAGPVELTHATFTNAGVTKVIIDTANGPDVLSDTNASTVYAFGTNNGGAATFALKGGNTVLNLALEGTKAFDASVGALDTGAALTVNVVNTSQPLTAVGGANDIGNVTNAANATFHVSGTGDLEIAGFSAAVNVQAADLAGNLTVTGSAFDDIIAGSTGKNFITGGNGVDTISLAASSDKVDTINLAGILAEANRDVVNGFVSGTGGDLIQLNDADTTHVGLGNAAIQEVNSNTGTINFLTAANDAVELTFAIAGNGLAGSNDGTALLAAVGTINVAANTDTGYLIAYQGGNAYVYYADAAAGNTVLDAAEIHLVGVLNNVAAGSLGASNFHFV